MQDNKLQSLRGLERFESLYSLNLSGNPLQQHCEYSVQCYLRNLETAVFAGTAVNPITFLLRVMIPQNRDSKAVHLDKFAPVPKLSF